MINPGVVAAIHVAGVRGDPCGAVRWTLIRWLVILYVRITNVMHTFSH